VTALRVDFLKGEGRRYRSRLHRADGVVVEFEGGAYNRVGGSPGELPHDLAHLVVEDELGLDQGVWGVLAAGGLFRHARVVEGRQPAHAAQRGRREVDASSERVMQAEILTRAVCDASAGVLAAEPGALRRQLGERWWSATLTGPALESCRRRLRAGAAEWSGLPAGGTLTTEWRVADGGRRPRRRGRRSA